MSEALNANEYDDQQGYHQKYSKNKMQFYSPVLQKELMQKPKRAGGYSLTAQLYSFEDSSDDSDKEKIGNQTQNLTGIPNDLKQRYEERSGFSFDDVCVHYNSDKPAKLQALAYAQGNQVYMGPGQEKHLEHELGHVVQQKQGIVHPTTIVDGLPVNDDPQLEQEASSGMLTDVISGDFSDSLTENVVQRLMKAKEFQDMISTECDDQYCQEVISRLSEYENNALSYISKRSQLHTFQLFISTWMGKVTDSQLFREKKSELSAQRNKLLESINEEIETIKNPLSEELQRAILEHVSKLRNIIIEHINNASCGSVSNSKLWETIKDKLKDEQNIDMLISKILSAIPQSVDNPGSYGHFFEEEEFCKYFKKLDKQNSYSFEEPLELLLSVTEVFNNLGTPILETLNDILYWMEKVNATDINEIKLTSSDIHTRGVGVCIVEYISEGTSKKLVIKPEDKSFEKAVYGKDTDSLASDFNSALGEGMLGDEQKGSSIGQLDIQTSESNGSAIEYFKHKTFTTMDANEKGQINKKSVESLVAFSSILGLSDLHYENAVYSELGDLFQLIDAEVGMSYKLDPGYLLSTARHKGGMIDRTHNIRNSIDEGMEINISVKDKNLMEAFLDNVKVKLKDKSVRITLMETERLFVYRSLYLMDLFDQNEIDTYYRDLCKSIDDLGPNCFKATKEECTVAANADFACGQIPYFELNLNDSILYQKSRTGNTIIAKFSDKDDSSYLDTMIADRMIALVDGYSRVQTCLVL